MSATLRGPLVLLAQASLLMACNSASLGGSSSTKSTHSDVAPSATANAAPSTDSADSATVVTAECGADGATQAKLVSAFLPNGVPGNSLDFKISVSDCSGGARKITADNISIGFDGTLSPVVESIGYRATAGDNPQIAGSLYAVHGSDMFKHKGDQYLYWATQAAVAIPSSEDTITVSFYFGGLEVKPTDGAQSVKAALKFGKAAPIVVVIPLSKPTDGKAGG